MMMKLHAGDKVTSIAAVKACKVGSMRRKYRDDVRGDCDGMPWGQKVKVTLMANINGSGYCRFTWQLSSNE